MSASVIEIDADLLLSAVLTVSGVCIVLMGFILKLMERNIINQMKACHDSLYSEQKNTEEYGKETRELVNHAHDRLSEHVETLHT